MSRNRWIGVAVGLCLAAPLLAGNRVANHDWPSWRGPNRDGISNEKGLLKSWPAEGPKLRWQVKDIGYGFGAPAVAQDRVFVLSNTDPQTEVVQALDVKTGKKLWAMTIGKVGQPDQQPNYPGARSTPTVDGNSVYVFGSDGDLLCLEASSGKLLWKKNVRTEFDGKPGTWAYAESPLIDGNTLICTPGGSQATLLALNKKTGAVLWKCVVGDGEEACYSSVVVATIGGVKQYIQFLRKNLVGVDAATGKVLWQFDKTAAPQVGGGIGTPVVQENLVYTSTSMTGGGLARINKDGNTFTTELVYQSRKLPSAIGGQVRVGDYLYGTGNATLYCVEYRTGTVKWEERGIGPGSLCYADGLLYIHGENGAVALVEATPEGYREKGRFTPPDLPTRRQEKAWAYPTLANGNLYIRDLGSLWCYGVRE